MVFLLSDALFLCFNIQQTEQNWHISVIWIIQQMVHSNGGSVIFSRVLCFPPQPVCSVTPVCSLPSLLWTASSSPRSVLLGSAACRALPREDGVRPKPVCVRERQQQTGFFFFFVHRLDCFLIIKDTADSNWQTEPHCTEHGRSWNRFTFSPVFRSNALKA